MRKIKPLHYLFLCFFILGIAIGLFFDLLSDNNKEAKSFLTQMAAQFNESNDPVSLTSITDFAWDRVCTLGADDSEPGIAKGWVAKKLGQDPELDISDHAQRAVIFYKGAIPIKTIVIENAYFEVEDNEYVFMATNEKGDDIGESCFNADAAYLNFILTWELGQNQSSSITLDDEPFGERR